MERTRCNGILLFRVGNSPDYSAGIPRKWTPTPYWGEITDTVVSTDKLSKIIPYALFEDNVSWLILYRSNLQNEVLVIPFPEIIADRLVMQSQEFFRVVISELLEYIGARNWYPAIGFRKLVDYLQSQKQFPFAPRYVPLQFQVIRTDLPVRELLVEDQVEANTVFREASQEVRLAREQVLSGLLTADDFETRDDLIYVFENALLSNAKKIERTFSRKIPEIVSEFSSVLDDETRSFLISSETVYQAISDNRFKEFDYSVCGCGLWKAVERELNSTIINYLRRTHDLIDVYGTPIGKIDERVNYKAGNRSVNINRRQRGSENFEGLELGKIMWLLSTRENQLENVLNSVFAIDKKIQDFILGGADEDLPSMIGKISKLRNGHAHIHPMTELAFLKLRAISISPESKGDALLRKILILKKKIQDQITTT